MLFLDRCLFNCQRAILPAPVKRADSFNIIIRLTGRGGALQAVVVWTFGWTRSRDLSRKALLEG